MPVSVIPFDQGLITFLLVLARVAGISATAPFFSARTIPVRFRAFLALWIALLLTPLFSGRLNLATDLAPISLALASESLLGLAMGAVLAMLFASLQVAGQLISHASGLSLAEVFDPASDESVPVFSQLLDQLGIALFLLVGGHRQLLAGLLDSYQTLPPGAWRPGEQLLEVGTALLTEGCSLGIRIAAPVLLAMLLSNLVLGLISRTLPQLNVMNVGLGLNALLALLVLSASLMAIPWIFEVGPADLWQGPLLPPSAGAADPIHP